MLLARPLAADTPREFGYRCVLVTGADAETLAQLRASQLVICRLGRPGTALLSGSAEDFARLARSVAAHEALARALAWAERAQTPPPPLVLGSRRFEWGTRAYLMGVVNVTPDSFSDGGQFESPSAAIEHGLAMVAAGADVLDVGGESTRPGASEVPAEVELRRVLPVIEGLVKQGAGVPISIDTSKPEVARAALQAGATLVNDVSAFANPEMAREVAARGAAGCLMHMRGTPRTMQAAPRYDDLVGELIEALEAALVRAVEAGVARERLLVDPGIGFGKTFAHNQFLLRQLGQLKVLGAPLVVGASRKAFLGALTGKGAGERAVASASAAAVAVLHGADLVRVHDVTQTRDAAAVAWAVRTARDGGEKMGW